MEKIIYIQLLNEGTRVFRPVLGKYIKDGIYQIVDNGIYDDTDEHWEFLPVCYVVIEEMNLEGRNVYVAIREYLDKD